MIRTWTNNISNIQMIYTQGARLFARASKPHVLELATALNAEELKTEGLAIQTFERRIQI